MTGRTRPPVTSWLSLAAAGAVGAGAGWLAGSTVAWVAVGAVIGWAVAAAIVLLGIRPLVAVPVGVGAGIGAYAGATVVGVLCQPHSCPGYAAAAAATTGIAAMVGIGLVVALVARSFDEYRESQERGEPPPTSSCSVDEDPSD